MNNSSWSRCYLVYSVHGQRDSFCYIKPSPRIEIIEKSSMKCWTIGRFNSTNLFCLWPFFTWWYTIYRILCTSVTTHYMRQLKDLKVTPVFQQNLLIANQCGTLSYRLSSKCIHHIYNIHKYNFISSVWNRFVSGCWKNNEVTSKDVENSVPKNSQMYNSAGRLKWIGMNELWWAILSEHSEHRVFNCFVCVYCSEEFKSTQNIPFSYFKHY